VRIEEPANRPSKAHFHPVTNVDFMALTLTKSARSKFLQNVCPDDRLGTRTEANKWKHAERSRDSPAIIYYASRLGIRVMIEAWPYVKVTNRRNTGRFGRA
jgi:hypothetical protein